MHLFVSNPSAEPTQPQYTQKSLTELEKTQANHKDKKKGKQRNHTHYNKQLFLW